MRQARAGRSKHAPAWGRWTGRSRNRAYREQLLSGLLTLTVQRMLFLPGNEIHPSQPSDYFLCLPLALDGMQGSRGTGDNTVKTFLITRSHMLMPRLHKEGGYLFF